MNSKERGDNTAEFFGIVAGMNCDWSPEVTVELLAREPEVLCNLTWLRDENIEPAVAEESREFLIRRMATVYGLMPEQCDRAFTYIEDNLLSKDTHGEA
jgi:hypothetical protein